MRAPGGGIDELSRDPDLIRVALQASFQHVTHAEVPADLPHVDGSALVGHGRVASDHVEVAVAGQIGDDILSDPVGKALLRRVTTEVIKGQDGDAGLGRGEAGSFLLLPLPPPAAEAEPGQEGNGQKRQQRRAVAPLHRGLACRTGAAIQTHPVGPHRPRDVLELCSPAKSSGRSSLPWSWS